MRNLGKDFMEGVGMMKQLFVLAVLAFAQPSFAQPATGAGTGAGTDAQAKAHDDLRAMKDRLVAALNSKNVDALLADVDPQIRLTTMDNVLSKGTDGVKGYYAKMMSGASRVVDDMTITAEPDELSQLSADGKTALTTGTATAHFKLAGGKEMNVPLRWTAQSVERDGKWKVASAQFSASMFDNPVLSAATSFAYWLAGGAGLLGLLIGWLVGRRKKAA